LKGSLASIVAIAPSRTLVPKLQFGRFATTNQLSGQSRSNKLADIWNVLKPYRFWLGHAIDKYHGNAYLLMDVNWPNPHFFQVFVQLDGKSWRHMHTEFVG